MRSTVRIDDKLMTELKARARQENVSLTRMLNKLLRAGLEASQGRRPRKRFKQKTHSIGAPRVELDKALALAADLDDEEILRKIAVRK